jgi:MoaA/NifB/PqqE/SkfB family radical SAM enzyme
MKKSEVLQAWRTILSGRAPSLSIEITKECPLRCPGCYAFDEAHLGGTKLLSQLSDFKGDELVTRVLAILDDLRPLHVSLVGGDPLVRHRELDELIPQIEARGIHTQVVTSAFRAIPAEWSKYKNLNVVVSIDGLQPEHDERRKPATYERILKNIEGARVNIHSTITAQIASHPGYLEQFLAFWSSNPAIAKVWFSLFTPQRGATDPEILSREQRLVVTNELRRLRPLFPKLDMHDIVIDEIANPPSNPEECIFARTT